MSTPWRDVERARFFNEIPSGVVVIDHQLQIVDSNRAFRSLFGECRGATCYEATRHRSSACDACPALATFTDGRSRIVEQSSRDRDGNDVHYLVHYSPVAGVEAETEYVAAIITDLTATKRLQREYQTLFENVPCFVAVINREYRVVKANQAFCRVFGEPTGERCYRMYKRSHEPCANCPAERTFATGKPFTSKHMGVSQDGRPTPYLVSTAPLLGGSGEVTHVIEMALDMTDYQALEEELSRANVMREALVENTMYAILVFDAAERIVLANRAAERLLGMERRQLLGRRAAPHQVPKALRKVLKGRQERLLLHEASVQSTDGSEVPVRFSAVRLDNHGAFMGSAVVAQDLREIKQLEHDKLEAERLAAVGQTVAGLAHGIKNILTGLEGGMYVTSSGLKKGDDARVRQGWEMLERNMARISSLARNLLAFSRGDRTKPRIIQPAEVVREVVALFIDRARQQGIAILAEVSDDVAPASFDPETLHSCLTNLISNAVDACLVSHENDCRITVKLYEEAEVITFEVSDTGCGMDYEVKQKAFTSFFTTKGKGGTGLGLLITRKIVQEHGGSIELLTSPGQGTTFRLRFPRERLPAAENQEDSNGTDTRH